MYDSSLKTGAFSTFIAKDLNLSYLQVSRKESDNLIFSIIWQLVNNLALMIWNSIVNRSIFERDLRIFVSLQTVENVQQGSTDKRVNQKVLTFQAWFLRWFRIPAFGQHWNLSALPHCASLGAKRLKICKLLTWSTFRKHEKSYNISPWTGYYSRRIFSRIFCITKQFTKKFLGYWNKIEFMVNFCAWFHEGHCLLVYTQGCWTITDFLILSFQSF